MVTELQSLSIKVRETTVIALQILQKSKASPWRQDKRDSIWKRDSEKTKSLLYEIIRSSSQQKLSSFLNKENGNIIKFWKSKLPQFQESCM